MFAEGRVARYHLILGRNEALDGAENQPKRKQQRDCSQSVCSCGNGCQKWSGGEAGGTEHVELPEEGTSRPVWLGSAPMFPVCLASLD